jgi:hypothetical protein
MMMRAKTTCAHDGQDVAHHVVELGEDIDAEIPCARRQGVFQHRLERVRSDAPTLQPIEPPMLLDPRHDRLALLVPLDVGEGGVSLRHLLPQVGEHEDAWDREQEQDHQGREEGRQGGAPVEPPETTAIEGIEHHGEDERPKERREEGREEREKEEKEDAEDQKEGGGDQVRAGKDVG